MNMRAGIGESVSSASLRLALSPRNRGIGEASAHSLRALTPTIALHLSIGINSGFTRPSRRWAAGLRAEGSTAMATTLVG
jgi:hypothetical protein